MKNYLISIILSIYFALYYYFKNTSNALSNYINNQYAIYLFSVLNGILIICLIFFIISIFQKIVNKIIEKGINETSTKVQKITTSLIINFINITKYIFAVYIGLFFIQLPVKAEIFIEKAFRISFILTILVLLSSFVNSTIKELKDTDEKTDMSKHVLPIINKIIIFFIWIFGIIMIVGNLGYDISALITGAGVGGLAIALASKQAVSNVFGAVSVIINSPFKIGDTISIGSFKGAVSDIGLSYLTLTDLNGHEILIPNEQIIKSSIQNFSNRVKRKNEFKIGLVYSTTNEKIEKAIEVINKILEEKTVEGKIIDYKLHFSDFGEFSLNIMGEYSSNISESGEYNMLKQEVNLKIKKAFEDNKIEMAFPTQTICMEK